VSERHGHGRMWFGISIAMLVIAVIVLLLLRAAGCFSARLDVAVHVRNVGSLELRGLSLDQEDGPGHVVIPPVAPGRTVEVRLRSGAKFGDSAIHLVDDVTGRDYVLPPHYFENHLRGTIDVEAQRTAPGAEIIGRARSDTGTSGESSGWQSLR
jgi:hypothetical protein